MARRAEPWRRKQGGAWYAWVEGRQVRLAGPEADKTAAYRALDALRSGVRAATVPRGQPTVSSVLAAFLTHQGERRAAGEIEPATLEHYTTLLALAIGSLGGRDASSLEPDTVRRWAASQPWGVNRQRAGIQAMRAAFRFAVSRGILDRDPLAGLKPPPAVPRDFDATKSIRDRLEGVATDRAWREFLEACTATGCRPGEVAAVTAADVDLEAGTWRVPNKTRRATGQPYRTVYLTPPVLELSRRLMLEHPTGPLFRNSQGRRWYRWAWGARMRRARKALELPDTLVTYSLRASFITDALEAGVNPAIVKELVGHQGLEILVRHYSRMAQRRSTLRSALESFRSAPAAREPDARSPASPEPAPERSRSAASASTRKRQGNR